MNFSQLIKKYVSIYPKFWKYFKNGIDVDKFKEELAEFNQIHYQNLEEIFTQINGCRYDDYTTYANLMLIDGFIPYDLSSALDEKKTNEFLPNSLFPIMNNEFGGYMMVSNSCESIYFYSIEYPEYEEGIMMFDSLSSMCESIYYAIDVGLIFYNNNGIEEIDDWERVQNHFKLYNPKSEYWDFMDRED